VKCRIIQPDSFFGYYVYLYEELPNDSGMSVMLPDGTMKTYRRGEVIEPTFRWHDDTLKSILAAIEGIGIKPENESVTAGKLAAQSAHLEDLRTLLNLQHKDGVFEASVDMRYARGEK